jgi:protein transport protein SEC61 subunit gamma and related proteins
LTIFLVKMEQYKQEAGEPGQQTEPKQAVQTQQVQPQQKQTKESQFSKLRRFGRECIRVFKVTKKPGKEEFLTIAKVSGLGLTVIGLLGFAFVMIRTIILK